MALPETVQAYLASLFSAERLPAYLASDSKGNLWEFGGHLRNYGLDGLKAGQPASGQVFFLEGMLPLTGGSIFLPQLKTEFGLYADVYMFHSGGLDWTVFLAATAADQATGPLQQRLNERQLAGDHVGSATRDTFLSAATLLEIFDVAAFVRVRQGEYAPACSPPDWAGQFWSASSDGYCVPSADDHFLVNFVLDAEAFWATSEHGRLRSGPWFKDINGEEVLVEATAIASDGLRVLLLGLPQRGDDSKPSVLQIARERGLSLAAGEHRERALRDDREFLQQCVEERTAELARVNKLLQWELAERTRTEEQLRQSLKMEAIGRLAGGVAHDFNNLLTVILGSAELGLADLPAGALGRSRFEDIVSAGTRAASLTHQLLAFSRKQALRPELVDLKLATYDMQRLLQRVIGEDVHCRTIVSPSTGRVVADAGQLQQVLLNLAVNAREAMPRGGELTVQLDNVDVGAGGLPEVPEIAPGAYVRLQVQDSGSGIAPEALPHIFEPYFTTKPDGTGLGLSTVYGIVKQSAGHIAVRSEPGKGTTFQVFFPRLDALPATEPSEPGDDPRGNETILVAEDDAGVRKLIGLSLESRGYRVLEATDATNALEIAHSFTDPIHLLLTDVVMPGLTGEQLATQLLARTPGLRVLFVSGFAPISLTAMIDDGAAFLQKPFTGSRLAQKVRQVLDQ